jgi:molecular chaperone HscC
VNLNVFQGESRMVRDNVFLGTLLVHVPPGGAGKEKIDCRFSYDTSGLLEVDVTVLSQKQSQRLVIEGNPGVLTKEEIEKRLKSLAALKVHPRDEAQNLAVMERAKRLYEENLGDIRAQVGEAMNALMVTLERQDPEEIATVRAQVSAFFDTVDRSILT